MRKIIFPDMKHINFTRAKLAQLKEKYDKARMEGHDQFQFEGHPILVSYAKYLIQYLEMQFKPDTKTVKDFPLESANEHHERA